MKKVDFINSCGIRLWILWVNKNIADHQVYFRNCPVCVVEQLNILSGFVPKSAIIESFYIPYYCADCDLEKPILFRNKYEYIRGSEDTQYTITYPEPPTCDQCKKEMSLEVVEVKYFNFLNPYKHKKLGA